MHRFRYYVPFMINLKYFDKTAPASYDFLGVNFYVSARVHVASKLRSFEAGAEMVVAKDFSDWCFLELFRAVDLFLPLSV